MSRHTMHLAPTRMSHLGSFQMIIMSLRLMLRMFGGVLAVGKLALSCLFPVPLILSLGT
jgi:hypothetical protein